MAAFVPHRPNKYFHVTASNGIVSNSPYTPLAIMTASPIASVSGIRSAMQMSSRYVRCAPNAVDDRTRDHHADRSSVLGSCFWPLIVRRPSIATTISDPQMVRTFANGLFQILYVQLLRFRWEQFWRHTFNKRKTREQMERASLSGPRSATTGRLTFIGI